jgi:hypothetical protein
VLDAFGRDRDAEADDRAHDRLRVRLRPRAVNERAVDLVETGTSADGIK